MNSMDSERDYYLGLSPETHATFRAAWEIVGFGFEFVEAAFRSPQPDISDMMKAALVSIAADSVRRFRAIIGLCEIGHLENAVILTRSLFETMLAEMFILREPTVPAKLPPLPVGSDPANSRVKLYANAIYLKADALITKIDATGAPDSIDSETRDRIRDHATAARKSVGDEWADRIILTHSFTGMNVLTLAEYCGMLGPYRTFYGIDSHVAHGGDAIRHMTMRDGEAVLDLYGPTEGIDGQLANAGIYLYAIVADIDRFFKLGRGTELLKLYERFNAIAIRSKC